MENEDDISTEEILASIRSILLEKQEAASKEEIFELTREMIYKASARADFNRVADSMIKDYAAVFDYIEKHTNSGVRVPEKTDL